MRTLENTVSSFFYYMWNAWCEEECGIVFASVGYKHFWSKWCIASKPTPYGAAEKFYAELTEDNRALLVNRACKIYNGSERLKPSSGKSDEYTIESTPMMKQFLALKIKHPDAILLFRCGDFCETYSEDAISVSEILGIALTKRANGQGESVEMAGFPFHTLDTYLPKLIRAGKRVAIYDQLENSKK